MAKRGKGIMRGTIITVLTLFRLNSVYAALTDTISQYGITWTFDKPYEYGQFVNGDYWVIGPVKIIRINPPSVPTDGITSYKGFAPGHGFGHNTRTMNGAEINPTPHMRIVKGVIEDLTSGRTQGYDSEMYLWHKTDRKMYYKYPDYDQSLNVALNVSPSTPLLLSPGESLVQGLSYAAGTQQQLKTAAVLTVLSVCPPDGSFRPPYSGTDKTIKFNKNQINYSILPSLSLSGISSLPDVSNIVSKLKRVWIDHFNHVGAGTGYSSPYENMPNFGREYADMIGEASLLLMIKEKELFSRFGITREDVVVGLIQLGIDIYGVLQNGGYWLENGGVNQGRKWPVLFAGVLLGDPEMSRINDYNFTPCYLGDCVNNPMTDPFAEDQTIHYVNQTHYDATHIDHWGEKDYPGPDSRDSVDIPYELADFGLPEWGILSQYDPSGDNKLWNTAYRRDCTGNSYAGIALAARILESKASTMTLWNNKAFFDYLDRFMSIEVKGHWQRCNSRFNENMWDKYRGNYGDGYIGLVYVNSGTGLVITNTINVSKGYDGVTGIKVSGETSTTAGYAIETSTFSKITGYIGSRQETVNENIKRIYGDCFSYGIVKGGYSLTEIKPAIIPVTPVNQYEGEKIEFDLIITDMNALDVITLKTSGMPAGSSLTEIDDRTFRFSWQTDLRDAGANTIVFTANDGTADSEPINVKFTVNKVSKGYN